MKALVEAAVAILIVWYFLLQQNQNGSSTTISVPSSLSGACGPFVEDPGAASNYYETYPCYGGPGAGGGPGGGGSNSSGSACGCGPCGGGCGCGGGSAVPAATDCTAHPFAPGCRSLVVAPGGTVPPGGAAPPPPPPNTSSKPSSVFLDYASFNSLDQNQ